MTLARFEHPEYQASKRDYRTWTDVFEGKQGVMRGREYLIPHGLETLDTDASRALYQNRLERTYYTNFIKPIVRIWQALFFKKDLIIPDEVEAVFGEDAEELENVDGRGRSLQSFLRDEVLVSELLYGRPIVQVNSFVSAADNLAEEHEQGLRPFMCSVSPLAAKDWKIEGGDPERMGRLNFIRIESFQMEPRESPSQEPEVIRFSEEYIRTSDGIVEYRVLKMDSGLDENVDEGKHKSQWAEASAPQVLTDHEEIPIVFNPYGMSWIEDITPQQLRYHNHESGHDNVLHYNGHPIKWVSGMPEGATSEFMAGAAYSTVFLPRDAQMDKLDPTDTTSLEKKLESIQTNIIKLGLNQPFVQASNSRLVQAADTQREQREDRVTFAESSMERLEDTINAAIAIYADFKGMDPPDERVQFSKDIEDDDIMQAAELFALLRGELPPTAKKQFIKYLVKEIPFEDPDAVMDEIEAMEDSSRGTIIQGLLNGRGQTGPADQGEPGGAGGGTAGPSGTRPAIQL